MSTDHVLIWVESWLPFCGIVCAARELVHLHWFAHGVIFRGQIGELAAHHASAACIIHLLPPRAGRAQAVADLRLDALDLLVIEVVDVFEQPARSQRVVALLHPERERG